jgi:hypothetical protein
VVWIQGEVWLQRGKRPEERLDGRGDRGRRLYEGDAIICNKGETGKCKVYMFEQGDLPAADVTLGPENAVFTIPDTDKEIDFSPHIVEEDVGKYRVPVLSGTAKRGK